jgi:hypothetical protein
MNGREPAYVFPGEAVVTVPTINKDTWVTEQAACDYVQSIARFMTSGDENQLSKVDKRVIMKRAVDIVKHEGVWCIKENIQWRVIVPVTLRREVALALHGSVPDGVHFGVEKVVLRLKQFFYWPGCIAFVTCICRGCAICQRNKRLALPRCKMRIPSSPWVFRERVAMDLTDLPETSSGSCKVLVVVEYATRFAWGVPFKGDPTAEEVLFYLTHFVFGVIGWPKELLSDNGGNMKAKIISEACARHGCVKRESTVYLPQANGKAENMVKQVITMLRLAGDTHGQEWDKVMPMALQCYNATPSQKGPAPFRALIGADVQPQVAGDLSLVAEAQRHQESEVERERSITQDLRMRQRNTVSSNTNRRDSLYELTKGQLVWARNWSRHAGVVGKLQAEFNQPFVVTHPFTTNMIQIRHLGSSSRQLYVHMGHVMPMYDTVGDKLFPPEEQAMRVMGGDERPDESIGVNKDVEGGCKVYQVRAIVEHAWSVSGRLVFEVAWKGFEGENTWQDEHDLDCQGAVARYWKSLARIHKERALPL